METFEFTRTQIASEEAGAHSKLILINLEWMGLLGLLVVRSRFLTNSLTHNLQFTRWKKSKLVLKRMVRTSDPFAMAIKEYYIADSINATTVAELANVTSSTQEGVTTGGTLDGSASTIAFGDVLSAAADVDSVMIGTSGKFDIFEINAPTAAGSGSTNSQIANEVKEVWIYGMSNQNGSTFDKDEIVIKLIFNRSYIAIKWNNWNNCFWNNL